MKVFSKGLAKKEAVLEFMIKEYLETHAEIKQIWSGWHTTVSWFIDSLISMLNSWSFSPSSLCWLRGDMWLFKWIYINGS